jgi:peptidyl-prolyl cis-trans isomerase SurA
LLCSLRFAARRLLPAIVLLAASLGLGAAASAQVSTQRIAAVVNDEVITTQELNARVNLVLATSGAPSDPETRQRLLQQVLRGAIDEKLELQEAKRLNVTVSDDEITRAFAAIAQRNRMDLGAFKAALAERGISESVLRNQLRGQIAWAKVVNRELRPRVVVTQDQVELALKEAASGGQDIELAVSEILLPVDSTSEQARVMREAADLVATLRRGADFGALARQVSVAASREAGGDLGWVRPSMILPEMRERLLALPAGGISDPVASPVGVHIFQVRERRDPSRPEPVRRMAVTRVSLAQVIMPLPPDAKENALKAAEKRAAELAPRLKSCKDIDAYAARSESEGSGSLGWLDVGDLPQALRQLVAQLEPGRISPPFRGPLGVQLLMVCDRQGREETVEAPAPPPRPALTAQQMRNRLEDEQLERLATRYLRELRKDAFIDIRLGV